MNTSLYNDEGKVRCLECGGYFHRVICHTLKAHNMNAEAYKLKFGLSLSKGICSETSRLKTSQQVTERSRNGLLEKFFTAGLNTQYKRGTSGRNIKKQKP